jgi:hypothetical protein
MKCPNCKQEIDQKAVVCVHCGSQFGFKTQYPEDKSSFWLFLLSLFVPPIGLFLYLLLRGDRDKTAKSALRGATTGIITFVVLTLLLIALGVFAILYFY